MALKSLPEKPFSRRELLEKMKAEKLGNLKWEQGKSFCLVYYPGDEYAEMISEAYNLYFTENALNPMSFPSLRKYESDVVSMVAGLMHGDINTTGTFTSGGTESILLAVKTARDYSRFKNSTIIRPEIILPVTAHPAFEKACHYFDVVPVFVEVDNDYKVSIEHVKNAITESTIMLVGSAPSYPQGIIDPVEEMAEIAMKHDLLFHVDACIGGFILPFLERLNYSIPAFDFRIKGISSMSVDLHKYGYAAKGASVILYKSRELRKFQFHISTSWPGGIYGSATISGSMPGGAVAAAYAALMGIGMEGYLKMTKATIETTEFLKREIQSVSGLRIMGNPLMSILAFTSDEIDIYELADELNVLGWHFERLQNPAGIHLTINQIHQLSAEEFIRDLKQCIVRARKSKLNRLSRNIKISAIKRLIKILPQGTIAKIQAQFSGNAVSNVRTAPMYGMMGALKGTEDLDTIILDILDKLHSQE